MDLSVGDDVWSAFPGTAGVSGQIADGWLYGLGFNRATPADVLIRLLDTKQLETVDLHDLGLQVRHPADDVDFGDGLRQPARRVGSAWRAYG